MTEKEFKVHAEGYQDTDDMGYAIAPPVTYYNVGNSEIGFNFDTEKEATMLCEAWNKFVKENEQLKQQNKMLRTNVGKLTDDVKYLRNLPSTHQKENKQLKKENRKLKDELNLLKLKLKEKNNGFDKIHKMYMEQIEENKEIKQKIESLKMEIAELRESEKDNYNITNGLW